MFTPCLRACLHNIWGDVQIILEDIFTFTACEKTCLHWVCYKNFEEIFIQMCSKWWILLKVDENFEVLCLKIVQNQNSTETFQFFLILLI